jgi:hypothetical protein
MKDDFEELNKIMANIFRYEWTWEVSVQKLCGKGFKIMHSSNVLAPYYISKKHFLEQWGFNSAILPLLPQQ